jgi:Kef-type K+ transport system membrane component KefB
MSALELVLLLLAASVLVVGFFRSVGLPPILGYLLVGALAGRMRWPSCPTPTRRVNSPNTASSS